MNSFEISPRRTLVVVGNGMVGHKLLEVLLAADGDDILTSDPDDLRALAAAAGVHIDLVPV